MSEQQHLYYMIRFVESNGEGWYHWELFVSEEAAEEAVWELIERDKDHDIAHYSVQAIPLRSVWIV